MIHGSNDVLDAICQSRVRTQGITGPQRTRDGILTRYGTFDGRIVSHVADDERQLGVLDLELAGVSDEGRNAVPALERVLDHFASGRTRCTEYKHVHNVDSELVAAPNALAQTSGRRAIWRSGANAARNSSGSKSSAGA